MPDHTLAVDLGGTTMRAAVVDRGGYVVARCSQATPQADRCPDALLALVGDLLADHPVGGAVIGVPGLVDHRDGALQQAPNLPPGWAAELREDVLSDHLGVAVALGNDADLAAVGEASFGAGRGVVDLVYVTVSTGVGAGVVLGGRLLRGRRSLAELGHTIVDLTAIRQGDPGKAEDRGSGSALGRRAERAGLSVTGAELAAQVRAGDPTATAVWDEVAGVASAAVVNAIHLYSPERVVLGGGMGRDPLLIPIVAAAIAEHGPRGEWQPQLRTAELGDDAGLVGAARWHDLTEEAA